MFWQSLAKSLANGTPRVTPPSFHPQKWTNTKIVPTREFIARNFLIILSETKVCDRGRKRCEGDCAHTQLARASLQIITPFVRRMMRSSTHASMARRGAHFRDVKDVKTARKHGAKLRRLKHMQNVCANGKPEREALCIGDTLWWTGTFFTMNLYFYEQCRTYKDCHKTLDVDPLWFF